MIIWDCINSYFEKPTAKLSNEQKEAIIASALATDEGRAALAQSMVEPIRKRLEYQAIGRKLLMVDELPQGALVRYGKNVAYENAYY